MMSAVGIFYWFVFISSDISFDVAIIMLYSSTLRVSMMSSFIVTAHFDFSSSSDFIELAVNHFVELYDFLMFNVWPVQVIK